MNRKGYRQKLCAAFTAAALILQWSAPFFENAVAAWFVTSIVTRTPSNGLAVPGSTLSFNLQSNNLTGNAVSNPFMSATVAQSEYTYLTSSGGFAYLPWITYFPSTGFNPPSSATWTISATVQNNYSFGIARAQFAIPKSYPHPTFDITAEGGATGVGSSSYTATVKVDVFPHVSAASLSKASIVNNGIDSTNLTVTVIDKNGCTDLQWGSSSLTLDLTAIGWSSAKAADSVSCNGDVATVSFNGITSTALAWGAAVIRVVDAAWHVAGNGDSAFSLASPEISTVNVGVQAASAPEISINSPSASSINVGASEDVSVNWQSSQSGSYAIYAWPAAACWSWTAVISWTAVANSPLTSVIPASNFQNGQNLVAVCVTNSEPTLGQRGFTVSKDAVAPTVQIVSSPALVGSNDPRVSFTATESWTYSVFVNGVDAGIPWSYPSANAEKEVTVPNAALTVNPGSNAVKIVVADVFNNAWEASVSISKDYTPPSPVSSVTLEDCDYVGNSWTECAKLGNPRAGMTGRDFHVNWANPPASESGSFQEYRIFVLPSGVPANPSVHQILATVSNFTSTGTVVSSSFAADSSWTIFPASWTGNYQAWVYAYKKNGLYSSAASSASVEITADAISYPTFVSASFVSGTWLAVTFSKPLSASLSDFDSSKISSPSSCFLIDTTSWTWAASTSWSTVTFAIENLSNPAKTCSDLSVLPWLAKDAEGLYNEDTVTSWAVGDAQKPSISISSPTSGAFIAGNGVFTVLYSLSEAMDGGTLFANFTDGSWAVVSASLASAASAGNKSKTFTWSTIGLLDWRTYSLAVSWQDVHGNSASSSPVSWIVFDVTAPSVPVLAAPSDNAYVKVPAVPLSWVGSVDNSSASVSISYEIQVSQLSDFSVMSAFWSVSGGAVTYSMNPWAATNTGYFWRVRSTDEAGNVGTWSASKTFFFDNVAPVVSESPSQSYFWNVTRSLSGYVRNGDSVELRAAISDNYLWTLYSTGISADLSGFWAGSSVAVSSFASGNAAWNLSATCSDGTKSSTVSATDVAGNEGYGTVSAICDNTAPSVQNSTITSPAPSAYVRWGSSSSIDWNTGFYASEVSPVSNPVTIETSSDGGNSWQSVATSVSNGGTASWTVPNVDTSNFKIRLSATDKLANVASGTVTVTVDSTDPSVASDAVTFPNGGEYLKGSTWTWVTVAWNPEKISDANIADSPISIDYTVNGTDWTNVASNIPNSGSYVWTTGAVDSNSVRVRVVAVDKAWRSSSDVSDAVFSIDSTLPTVTPAVPPTPPSGSYLSASGFDMGVSGSDVNLAKVSYSLTDGSFYWNASSSSWLGGQQWNDVCVGSAACAGATDVALPTLTDGSSYQFVYRSTDRAGNVTDSLTHSYVADLVPPTVVSNVSSGAAYSGSVSVFGTSSDARSGVSSVRASIKRLSDGKYWGGSAFDQSSENLLLVSTSDDYANWTLTGFSIPSGDPEGTAYQLNVKWIDKAYRINNESSTGATFVKDSVWPTVASDVWVSPTVWEFWKGAHPKTLVWNPSKITDAISGVDQVAWITVEYATGAGIWHSIASSYANSGSVDWTVPVIDADVTFRISAKDALWNVSAWVVSPVVTVDTLQPQISTVETMDRAASGKIDGLLVTMSEPVSCATLRSADFTIAGVGTPTATSGCAGNSQTFVLEFSPFEDTSSVPWLTYLPSGILEDRAGNSLSPVAKASVDKAVPRLLSATVLDADSNGKIDRIRALFSESLSATADVSAWTLSNVLAGMGTAPVSVSVSASWATLVIAEPTSYETSTGGVALSFAGGSAWKDLSNNSSAPKASSSLSDSAAPRAISATTHDDSGYYSLDVAFSEPLASPSFSGWSIGGTSTYSGQVVQVAARVYRFKTSDPTSADTAKPFTYSYVPGSVSDVSANALAAIWDSPFSDGIAPKVVNRKTRDADGDGKIDSITVGFSETLNANVSGTVASVSGYVVDSYASSGTWLTISLVERALPDTDSVPTVQLTNSSLADSSWNVFATEASWTAATDAVWPVVTSTRYDSAGKVVVTLSEPYSGTPANDWFAFSWTAVSVSSASAFSATEVELNVSGTVTYGTTSVSAVPGKVKDALNNSQSVVTYAKISASIVINEVMWSGSGSSLSQYVELRNLWPSPIDVSWFRLDSASANGTATLVLPASQTIAGNGYYLVAASATATVGNLLSTSVVPDHVWALSLSAAQVSDLVLKNASWSVYDRAKANPFPAWDDASVVSMERKETPWDGLSASNWYSAQTGASLFDTVWPKGTPGQANVFDATAPTVTLVTPTESSILASGSGIVVTYDYSDAVLMQANPARSFKIEKNDGSGNFSDVTAISVTSSGADAARATHSLSTLGRWAYRTTFTVSDSTWNQSQKVANFYVDSFTMDVSPASADIGTLDHQSVTTSAPVTVTVSTVGAPFALTFSGGTLSAGYDTVASWNGTSGFAFECATSWSAGWSVCDSTKRAVSQTALETLVSPLPDSNGNLKTYVYEISFSARPDELNTAWTYVSNARVSVSVAY